MHGACCNSTAKVQRSLRRAVRELASIERRLHTQAIRRYAEIATATSTSTASSKHTLGSKRFKLAIVGSGPAGFYAASRLLAMNGSENTTIDMYEELPVPFGLVRYGVAPDHPEVKVSDRAEMKPRLEDPSFVPIACARVDAMHHLPPTETFG